MFNLLFIQKYKHNLFLLTKIPPRGGCKIYFYRRIAHTLLYAIYTKRARTFEANKIVKTLISISETIFIHGVSHPRRPFLRKPFPPHKQGRRWGRAAALTTRPGIVFYGESYNSVAMFHFQ